jgi:hypothetical protein
MARSTVRISPERPINGHDKRTSRAYDGKPAYPAKRQAGVGGRTGQIFVPSRNAGFTGAE